VAFQMKGLGSRVVGSEANELKDVLAQHASLRTTYE
jgi:hypothetical protein